ncbi:MAG: hypothetical protein RI973_2042, partial [Bacteroidota bacterium]
MTIENVQTNLGVLASRCTEKIKLAKAKLLANDTALAAFLSSIESALAFLQKKENWRTGLVVPDAVWTSIEAKEAGIDVAADQAVLKISLADLVL